MIEQDSSASDYTMSYFPGCSGTASGGASITGRGITWDTSTLLDHYSIGRPVRENNSNNSSYGGRNTWSIGDNYGDDENNTSLHMLLGRQRTLDMLWRRVMTGMEWVSLPMKKLRRLLAIDDNRAWSLEETCKQIVKINSLRRKRFQKIVGHLAVVQYLEEFSHRDACSRKDIYGEFPLQIILFQL
jgi:hypothetical protein